MPRFIILIAFLSVSLVGCNRAPRFITSTGTFNVFGSQMKVTVVETQDGGINYTVTRGTSTTGPGNPLIRKGSAWFIYAASPDAVWTFDGEKSVLLIEFSDKGSKFTSSEVVPDLLKRAPAAFLARLPPHLKRQ